MALTAPAEPAAGDVTPVRIRAAVNTGTLVEALVQTPGGRVLYAGDNGIAGVPGTAAPVALNFLDVVGSRTGKMFPTGNRIEVIDGVQVSGVDVAMPMMIARAGDFGVTGHETEQALNDNRGLFERMEPIRLKAGERMGLGDVTRSVTPKIGLIAPARAEGAHFAVRYFMPWDTHTSLAVTGSQCLAACAIAPGTVAPGIAAPVAGSPATIRIEHPMGVMDVLVNFTWQGDDFEFHSAGVVRTARMIARGEIFVPSHLMEG